MPIYREIADTVKMYIIQLYWEPVICS